MGRGRTRISRRERWSERHLRPRITAMGMAMPRPLTVILMATATATVTAMATPSLCRMLRPTATPQHMATVTRRLIVTAIGVPGTSIIRIIGRTITSGTTRSGATIGVTDGYVRLSGGTKHIDDIVADLDQARAVA